MILCHIEVFEYCEFDIMTKTIKILPHGWKPKPGCRFEGLYYIREGIFFAIYVTKNGPMMYFEEKEYPLTPELTINVDKVGKERHFSIKEYGIEIDYPESKFIDMDVWSTEEDVDLFVKIANNYKDKSFYELFTSKE